MRRSTADLCQDPTADKLCGGPQRNIVRSPGGEVADECNTERVVVVSANMSAHPVPTYALVHVAVLTDEEVIADIPPTCGKKIRKPSDRSGNPIFVSSYDKLRVKN